MSIHTCTDRTPYTYLIGWAAADMWYYGCRYAKSCHPSDLMVTYLTSSRTVKKYIKQHGLPTVIQTRRVFNTIVSCRQWETRVLTKMRVVESVNWFNKHDKAAPPHMAGSAHPGFNIKHTTERRLLNSESNKRAWAAKSDEAKSAHATATGLRVHGTKQSAEHIANRTLTGERNGMWGKHMSVEANAIKRDKMQAIALAKGDSWIGTVNLKESTRSRMANGTHPSQCIQICSYCNRSIKGKSQYSRWHGNSCKHKPQPF